VASPLGLDKHEPRENQLRSKFGSCRSFSVSDSKVEEALSCRGSPTSGGHEKLADGSGMSYALPTVGGNHQDLKSISPQTMTDLIDDKFQESVENCYVVDCRYPYEYEGGHILNGENLYTEEMVLDAFFKTLRSSKNPEKQTIIIFHCEFSKERGPRLMRFLRKHDRKENAESYPYLQYPEMYLLDGGYKNFFESAQKQHCIPREYVPMFDQKYVKELKYFRRKTKSWTGNDPRATVGLQRTRTGLKF
jgi:rhodanese-related sulfurtransferase